MKLQRLGRYISYKNEYYGNGGNENSTNPTSSRNTYKMIRTATHQNQL
jgi:hypothetical protein